MKVEIDKNIEILYGLSYCINREKNDLKDYNTKENNKYIDDFYNIYLNNIDDSVKNKILSIGDYHRLAKYYFNNGDMSFIDCSIFDSYFENSKLYYDMVIKDICSNKYLDKVDFDSLKKFYNLDLGNVNIYVSLFISGGFGIYTDRSIIILGFKYNKEKDKYGVNGTLVCKLYHEFSHPYVSRIIENKGIELINSNNEVSDYYKDNYIEELLVRTMETIFSSKIFGNEYISWAIENEEKNGFELVKDFVSVYLKNEKYIKNINDYIIVLLENILINELNVL